MKKLLSALILCSVLLSVNVKAHSDHDEISGQQAVSVALKSVKQMTFKDMGFEAGKLDESWKAVSAEQFSVVSIEDGYYVVSGKNGDKTLFFKISNSGRMLDVKTSNAF
ncbi:MULTISPECIES: DUF6488 family protein [Chromatiaceae]|jgi:hypothetical protein|uniref:PepSY domain-containing protein n=1 Tax=Arsukibacterium indicum TaxID=2848612 RepID=A0ABS6MND1_9GAMM|nr:MULTISPECIES: DUF6488 family protein [Chromatiaceae]MBV2130310.1 hypothetical protein [Arsukibacterium indicum]MCD1596772.1 DUF6488 family protein [Rheinheimera aquimaris]